MKLKKFIVVITILCLAIIANSQQKGLSVPVDSEMFLKQYTWTLYFKNLTKNGRIERYKAIQFRNEEILNRWGTISLGNYIRQDDTFVLNFDDFQGITIDVINDPAIHGFDGYGFKEFYGTSYFNVDVIIIRGSKIERFMAEDF